MKTNRIIAAIVSVSLFILAYRLEGTNGVLLVIVALGLVYLVATTPKDGETK